MNRKLKKIIFTCAIATVLAPSLIKLNIFADTPGSESDPLVSKSYVDGQISKALGNSSSSSSLDSSSKEEIIADVLAQIDLLYGGDVVENSVSSATYTPVYVTQGKILYGMEGTEIILRSGSAKTYITATDGIVNITTGENLVHNTEVLSNNMLICPRGDGRGVIVTSGDAWFIVKGEYEVK